jgi:hypothetical protein
MLGSTQTLIRERMEALCILHVPTFRVGQDTPGFSPMLLYGGYEEGSAIWSTTVLPHFDLEEFLQTLLDGKLAYGSNPLEFTSFIH